MNFKNSFLIVLTVLTLNGCADFKNVNNTNDINKKLYSSKGFALVYEQALFDNGTVKKK
jgi:hypothetical protein